LTPAVQKTEWTPPKKAKPEISQAQARAEIRARDNIRQHCLKGGNRWQPHGARLPLLSWLRATDRLVKAQYLLQQDVPAVIQQAMANWDSMVRGTPLAGK